MEEVLLDRGNRHHAGVTLVEVMIATLVLAVALLASLSIIASEWQMIERTQEQLYVSQIIETRLEELRSLSFDDLVELENGMEFELSPFVSLSGETIVADDRETYEVALRGGEGRIYISQIEPDIVKATVEISFYPARDSNRMKMRNVAYITRNGVGQ